MTRPLFADRWYGALPVDEVRWEIQNLYANLGGGGGGDPGPVSVAWGDITGVPADFPPEPHTHVVADVTDLAGLLPPGGSAGQVLTKNSATDFDTAWAALTGGVPTSRTITAGNGLSGGGDLSADVTLTLGTPSTLTTGTSNAVTATSHTHAVTFPVTGAGNGVTLSSGNIVLGTPSSITASSTNSVTASSHTHNIDWNTTQGTVGSYILGHIINTTVTYGSTYAGSSISPAGFLHGSTSGQLADGQVTAAQMERSGTTLAGTWRALGESDIANSQSRSRITLFVRIS